MEEFQSKRESNKAKKKAAFIDAAKKLFIQKGFENTSIDEITREAGLTKRTLYQYFASKEDLFYAVILEEVRQFTFAYEEAMSEGNSALEKIRLANSSYLEFYLHNLDIFRLINYKPANQQNSNASPHYQEVGLLDGRRVKLYTDLVAAAATDGSVNPELDVKKAVYFVFFAAFSMLYTISNTENLWDLLGFSEQEFLRFSFDLLAKAIK